MARVANTPCADCGRLLFVGRGSRPQPTCRECRAKRRAAAGLPHSGPYVKVDKVTVVCPCGITVVTNQSRTKYCSELCRSRFRVRGSGVCLVCGAGFTHRQSRAQEYCSYTCRGFANRMRLSSSLNWQSCDQCDTWFVSRSGAKRCSDPCRRMAAIAYRDAYADSGEGSARILRLYRLAIAELNISKASMWRRTLTDYLARRDGPACAICHKPIDTTLPSGPRGNPLGPSIDHVIPVSHGGPDTLANLRLAHWRCNNARGNRGGNEQLRLVG